VDAKDLSNIKEFYTNKNSKKGNLLPAYTKDTLMNSFIYVSYLRYLNKREKIRKIIKKDSLYFVNQDRKIDSLFQLGEVSDEIYEVLKIQNTFKYPKEIKVLGDGFVFDESSETLY